MPDTSGCDYVIGHRKSCRLMIMSCNFSSLRTMQTARNIPGTSCGSTSTVASPATSGSDGHTNSEVFWYIPGLLSSGMSCMYMRQKCICFYESFYVLVRNAAPEVQDIFSGRLYFSPAHPAPAFSMFIMLCFAQKFMFPVVRIEHKTIRHKRKLYAQMLYGKSEFVVFCR